MMERLLFPSDDGPEGRSAPGQSPSRPAEAGPDPRIEAYLDAIFAPLVEVLPLARRQELRAELAAHLDALVEARHELGSEPDAAVRAALEQLGDARRLGREWARECRRPASAPPWLGTRFERPGVDVGAAGPTLSGLRAAIPGNVRRK